MNLFAKMKKKRELNDYWKTVNKINELEQYMESLSDKDLKGKTNEFKQMLHDGKSIHDVKVEAFAVVREVSKRVIGLRHYDVQLIGGLALLEGNIAEMATGEGKTLVASLPSYLIALEGKGVHIITVNDYLARRDRELIGQIHEFLGLTVGLNVPLLGSIEKQQAYQCDITYGVGTEFGFDFLRDNTVRSVHDKVQRPYHFAIVDEVDSVLIDEAETPLIIAGKTKPSDRLYTVCARVIQTLKEKDDYTFDQELKVVNFTEDGLNKCESVFGIDNLFDLEHSSLFHSLLQALRARVLFQRDVDYIVEDGEIKLVDMNTGRIMEGRSLSDGLHQAIESKEGLENTEENKTHAAITIQNYYRMYPHLSGMTGTAKTDEKELQTVYNMDVIQIPTNKPNQRIDHKDLVYVTREQKFERLVREVAERHQKGQPILIGTTSILQSEDVAKALDEQELPYQLLNAKSVEQEARLISLAGQKSQITIATNMAGRGTDIMLGEGVAELGGLHVIGTERNDSRRIDDQLVGRSGRQGDPGSSQFIISLDDYLFIRYATDEVARMKPKLKIDRETGAITSANIHSLVDTAQKISEGIHYSFREYNLNLEDVINEQREVIYTFRDKTLEKESVLQFLSKQMDGLQNPFVQRYCSEEVLPEEWDIQGLEEALNQLLLVQVSLVDETYESIEEVNERINTYLNEHFDVVASYEHDEEIEESMRGISLFVIDTLWKKHLDTMGQLKQGIGIRQYQQDDPIDLFKQEGFTLFETMFDDLTYEIASRMKGFIKRRIEHERQLEAQ